DSGRAFARGEQPRNARHLGVGIDVDAAHDVVSGRPDLHRLLGNVDVRQLFELVVHTRQLALDMLRGVGKFSLDPGDVEINPAVRRTPALFDFTNDAPRNVVAGQ